MPLRPYADELERLYERYNQRRFVHPDPLEFLYAYDDPGDREVAGVVAAMLAYGNVKQILRSVGNALERLGPGPAGELAQLSADGLRRRFDGFKHRFTTGEELASLLWAVRRARAAHGSLEACLLAGMRRDDETILPALSAFVGRLCAFAGRPLGHLLPDPARGSACKRLNLLLRWMVRRDAVDCGAWRGVRPEQLIVPLDVHMHRLGRQMGATRRRSADLRTALELTAAFRAIRPDDPVRYDFALTRLGIRDDAEKPCFLTI